MSSSNCSSPSHNNSPVPSNTAVLLLQPEENHDHVSSSPLNLHHQSVNNDSSSSNNSRLNSPVPEEENGNSFFTQKSTATLITNSTIKNSHVNEANLTAPSPKNVPELKSGSNSAIFRDNVHKLKMGSGAAFSIQSILARPEPVRPLAEFGTAAQFLHYSNLAAAFFPHHHHHFLHPNSGVSNHQQPPFNQKNMINYSAIWQSQMHAAAAAVGINSNNLHNELPENLSTKSSNSISTSMARDRSSRHKQQQQLEAEFMIIPPQSEKQLQFQLQLQQQQQTEQKDALTNNNSSRKNHYNHSLNNNDRADATNHILLNLKQQQQQGSISSSARKEGQNSSSFTLVNPITTTTGTDDEEQLVNNWHQNNQKKEERDLNSSPSLHGGSVANSAPSSPAGSGQSGTSHRRKKTRTVFSRSQVFQLESTFDLKRYLSSADRAALAGSLNLSEQQIKIWFQNRRNKWKRQISSETDSAIISAGQMHAAAAAAARFPGHHHPGGFPMSLYQFAANAGNMMSTTSAGDQHPNSNNNNPSGNSLFCSPTLHPMYMPFSRSSV